MSVILKTRNLSIGYKKIKIAEDLSLELRRGEVTALIGRNGAGKTTLIKTLTGNLNPLGGEIFLEGRKLGEYKRTELAKAMAIVNTDPNMAGGLRLKELVGLGRIPYTGRMGVESKADKDIIEKVLETTGIAHKKESFVSELSDGERQKGMIARALAQQTPIIIMDEPFSFLDVASRLEMLDLLNNLAKEDNKAILLSTHEVAEALKMSVQIWLFLREEMITGRPEDLIERGDIDRLFEDTKVKFDRERGEFRIP